MHIVLATLEYPTEPYRAGGMCWAFAKIASGLRNLGHDVTVVVPADNEDRIVDVNGTPVRRYRIRSSLPVRIERAMAWRIPTMLLRFNQAWSLYRALDRLDMEKPFDAVLAAAAPDSFFAAGSRRWSYVMRTSGNWALMDVCNHVPQTASAYFAEWMEFYGVRRASALVSPSKLHCEIYRFLGCDSFRRIFTPAAGERATDASSVVAESGEDMPERFILFYGSLQARKGTLVLARALPDVLTAHPDLDVVLIGRDLAVPGIGSMRKVIEGKLAKFGSRVRIFGAMEQEEIFRYVRSAEWIVLPSIIDNLPNTVLESMWHGKALIATSDSGTDDLIEDGVSGVVVKQNDAESLAAGLERALSLTPAARRDMGRRAQESVRRACDSGRIAKEFERVLVTVRTSGRSCRLRRAVAALRLFLLRLRWLFVALRYARWGAPAKDRSRLESLCARFAPGHDVINV